MEPARMAASPPRRSTQPNDGMASSRINSALTMNVVPLATCSRRSADPFPFIVPRSSKGRYVVDLICRPGNRNIEVSERPGLSAPALLATPLLSSCAWERSRWTTLGCGDQRFVSPTCPADPCCGSFTRAIPCCLLQHSHLPRANSEISF